MTNMGTNEPPSTTVEQDMTAIVTAFRGGLCGIANAGRIVAARMETCPDLPDMIHSKYPEISPQMVLRLRDLGLRKLHPKLLIASGSGPQALRRLPFEVQENLIANGVDVLLDNGESLRIDPLNLQPNQARQAIGPNGNRSLAEQRAWLEEQKSKARVQPNISTPYRVVNGELVVNTAYRFSRKELAQILAQLS